MIRSSLKKNNAKNNRLERKRTWGKPQEDMPQTVWAHPPGAVILHGAWPFSLTDDCLRASCLSNRCSVAMCAHRAWLRTSPSDQFGLTPVCTSVSGVSQKSARSPIDSMPRTHSWAGPGAKSVTWRSSFSDCIFRWTTALCHLGPQTDDTVPVQWLDQSKVLSCGIARFFRLKVGGSCLWFHSPWMATKQGWIDIVCILYIYL